MEPENKIWDLLVLGTGLAESIVAAAASKAGKSVLHLDAADYYGRNDATLPLQQLLQLTSLDQNSVQHRSLSQLATPRGSDQLDEQRSSSCRTGPNVGLDQLTSLGAYSVPLQQDFVEDFQCYQADALAESLHQAARRINIDLQPQLILARGALVDMLVESGVSRYIEFRSLEAAYAYQPGASPLKIPAGKGDIFAHRGFSLLEKRRLMKFLQFALDLYHAEHQIIDLAFLNELTLGSGRMLLRPQNKSQSSFDFDAFRRRPFRAFLAHCELSSPIQDMMMHAVALVPDHQPLAAAAADGPGRGGVLDAEDGMRELCRHLAALGRFGSTGFLAPMYGSGELSQAFCRLCAVHGGVYMLRTSLAAALLGPSSLADYLTVAMDQAAAHALLAASAAADADMASAAGTAGMGEGKVEDGTRGVDTPAPAIGCSDTPGELLPRAPLGGLAAGKLGSAAHTVQLEVSGALAVAERNNDPLAQFISPLPSSPAPVEGDTVCLGVLTADGTLLRARQVLSGAGYCHPPASYSSSSSASSHTEAGPAQEEVAAAASGAACADPLPGGAKGAMLGVAVFIATLPLGTLLRHCQGDGSSRDEEEPMAGLVSVVVPPQPGATGERARADFTPAAGAAVFALQHDSTACMCPEGYYVIHLMTHVRCEGTQGAAGPAPELQRLRDTVVTSLKVAADTLFHLSSTAAVTPPPDANRSSSEGGSSTAPLQPETDVGHTVSADAANAATGNTAAAVPPASVLWSAYFTRLIRKTDDTSAATSVASSSSIWHARPRPVTVRNWHVVPSLPGEGLRMHCDGVVQLARSVYQTMFPGADFFAATVQTNSAAAAAVAASGISSAEVSEAALAGGLEARATVPNADSSQGPAAAGELSEGSASAGSGGAGGAAVAPDDVEPPATDQAAADQTVSGVLDVAAALELLRDDFDF